MSTYMVNECPVDLPLDNPTAGDLKKHLGSPENSSVVVIWPNGRAQLLQDHESIPLHATNISIIPTDHESIILLPPPTPIPTIQAGEGKDGSPGEGEGGHPPDHQPVEISPTDVATIVGS